MVAGTLGPERLEPPPFWSGSALPVATPQRFRSRADSIFSTLVPLSAVDGRILQVMLTSGWKAKTQLRTAPGGLPWIPITRRYSLFI